MRQHLRQLFRTTLPDLDPGPRVQAALSAGALPAGQLRSALVIAFGKAARPMATAALAQLTHLPVRGLLVPPEPDDAPLAPLAVIPAGHPLPSAGSLRAGARTLELCRQAGPEDLVLFLVSGGGSALLEAPLDPAVSLAHLRTLHRALVGSGADIAAINVVRKHVSATKGGRLARAAAQAGAQWTLAVSDVPGDDLAALASGPTVPDRSTPADCRAVLDRFGLWEALPPPLHEPARSGNLPPTVPPGDPAFARSHARCLLANADAVAGLRRRAEAAGLLVGAVTDADEQPVAAAAERLLAHLRDLVQQHPGRIVAVVAGGELSCPLPPDPGIGGRNQHFVLECALRIQDRPMAVLSAGTDGIDGNSPAAGAVADGTTVARAAAAGLDARDHLARYDAHALFAALGDAVVTGPTGTNVRDLRLLVAWPD